MPERYHAEMSDATELALIAVTMDGQSINVTATQVLSDGTREVIVVPMTRHKMSQLRESISALLLVDECAHQ